MRQSVVRSISSQVMRFSFLIDCDAMGNKLDMNDNLTDDCRHEGGPGRKVERGKKANKEQHFSAMRALYPGTVGSNSTGVKCIQKTRYNFR
jgi:hypothetical protein